MLNIALPPNMAVDELIGRTFLYKGVLVLTSNQRVGINNNQPDSSYSRMALVVGKITSSLILISQQPNSKADCSFRHFSEIWLLLSRPL